MAYGQPSVNQIANLYQGNPQALANKVATEPKGPTGLPRDLSKLMALNIDLTESDASKRQSAMTALQQMQQQGGGEPPTVAQTIQQQAAEKAKAIAVQQQRQQQGLQALMQGQGLMGAIPPQVPQPERQPSGLDELPANLGENYAGGGIVAFNGEDDSDVKDEEKLSKEDAQALLMRMMERTGQLPAPEPKAPAPREPYKGPQQVTQRELAEEYNRKRWAQQAEDAKKPEDEMLKLVKMPFQAAGRGIADLAKSLYGRQTPGATPEQTGPDMNMGEAIMQASANRAATEDTRPVAIGNEAQRSLPSVQGQYPSAPAKPARDLADLAAQKQRVQSGSTGTAPPSAPTAPLDPMKEKLNKFFEASLNTSPAQQREEAIARMREALGAPDTSAQEKYIQQLEARRAQFAEPTDPYERFRNYARTAANAGGRTWQQTGAATSQALEQQRLSNQQKDMEILKELMSESGKVAETKRGYKKELFGFGEKTYDDAFKTGMESAKELGLYGRQAELFAHQSAEKVLDRKSSERIAGMPGAEQKMFNQISADWLSKPENKGKTISDAYSAYMFARSPSAATKGVMTRDQAEDNVRKDLENFSVGPKLVKDATEALKAAGVASPNMLQIKKYLVDQNMNQGSTSAGTSSGKVPPLPAGFKPD